MMASGALKQRSIELVLARTIDALIKNTPTIIKKIGRSIFERIETVRSLGLAQQLFEYYIYSILNPSADNTSHPGDPVKVTAAVGLTSPFFSAYIRLFH